MTQTDIEREAQDFVEKAVEENGICPVTWATQAIVTAHPDIVGSDADWYTVCAHGHIRDAVRKAIRSLDPKDSSEQLTLTLEGFKWVQKAYNVIRDGEQVAVRTDLMTKEEGFVKVGELRAHAIGLTQHADELERYLIQRSAKPA